LSESFGKKNLKVGKDSILSDQHDPLPFSRIKKLGELFCHFFMMFIHVVFDMTLIPHLSPSPLIMASRDIALDGGFSHQPLQGYLKQSGRVGIHHDDEGGLVLRGETDERAQDGKIRDKAFVLEGDDGWICEKNSGATAREDSHSIHLLIVNTTNQAFYILFDLLLVFDQGNPPGLSIFELFKNSLELILGKKTNALSLLFILPFGIEIKGHEWVGILFKVG
jgi:hypothetical protein